MLGVSSQSVSDAKIVNDVAEDDVFGVVTPRAGGEWNGAVTVWCQKCNELVVGETPGLGKTEYSAQNFHIHVPIVEQRAQIVLLDDGIG
jgi:hypothetical protein